MNFDAFSLIYNYMIVAPPAQKYRPAYAGFRPVQKNLRRVSANVKIGPSSFNPNIQIIFSI